MTKRALVYRSADRATKTWILDELIEWTGWRRDYARAALRQALVIRHIKPRKPRRRVYGDSTSSRVDQLLGDGGGYFVQ